MGRKHLNFAGRDWVWVIPLAVISLSFVAVAAVGLVLTQNQEAMPAVTGPAAGQIIRSIGEDSRLLPEETSNTEPAAAPSAPREPQSSAPWDNVTGIAGAGTVRASFTVVSP